MAQTLKYSSVGARVHTSLAHPYAHLGCVPGRRLPHTPGDISSPTTRKRQQLAAPTPPTLAPRCWVPWGAARWFTQQKGYRSFLPPFGILPASPFSSAASPHPPRRTFSPQAQQAGSEPSRSRQHCRRARWQPEVIAPAPKCSRNHSVISLISSLIPDRRLML